MRMTAIAACVPFVAGALAAQTTSSGRIDEAAGSGVAVMVLPPSPETHEALRYVLGGPAYVAAFVVYPGAGVRLLYPTVDVPERLHRAGYNTEQLIGASFDNDIYRAVLGPISSGPAYLYVIASRHPLDVARYVHKPMSLASAIGNRESRSFYGDVQFDALLNNAVALGDDQSWDSDVYTLWPNSITSPGYAYNGAGQGGLSDRTATDHYTYLLCADGGTRLVPINYPFVGCPGQSRVRPADLVPRQIQQSASAAPAVPAAVPSSNGRNGVEVANSTVLPTIIGVRPTDAQRRAAIQQHAASQRFVYTAANGDQEVAAPVTQASSRAQFQTIDVYSDRSAERSRGNNDAMHDHDSAERRAQLVGQARELRENGGAGSPRLSPNPVLSPNPTLAPAPGFSAPQRQPEAPRREFAPREPRNEQRAAPSPTTRFEQTQMSPAVAAPSARGVAETSSANQAGRSRAIP